MQRYLDLSVQTFTWGEEGDLDRMIEQNLAQLDRYTKAVEDIKINNIETFRQIQLILHPPQSLREPIRQIQPEVLTSVSFKPCQDLRPSLLVCDCTLKEVEHFNEKFANYIMSDPNQTIPTVALLTGLCQHR